MTNALFHLVSLFPFPDHIFFFKHFISTYHASLWCQVLQEYKDQRQRHCHQRAPALRPQGSPVSDGSVAILLTSGLSELFCACEHVGGSCLWSWARGFSGQAPHWCAVLEGWARVRHPDRGVDQPLGAVAFLGIFQAGCFDFWSWELDGALP